MANALANGDLKIYRSLGPEEWVLYLHNLRLEINSSIEGGDFDVLEAKVGVWRELLDAEDDFLFEDLWLMHPLARAVIAERPNAAGFLARTCGLRLDAFHPSSCRCRLCQRLATDRRFLQRHLEVVVLAASRPLYALCTNPDGAIRHCLRLQKDLRRYESRVTAASWKPIAGGIEETILTVLDVADTEREAIQLLEEPDEALSSAVEQRLGTVLGLVRAGMRRACVHPTVQSVVDHEWTSGCGNPVFRSLESSKVGILLHSILSLFNYFFIVPLTVLFPHPRLVKHLETPTVRLEVTLMSYWVLMFVSILAGHMTHPNIIMVCKGMDKSNELVSAAFIQCIFGVMIVAKILRNATAIWYCQSLAFVGGYDFLLFSSVIFYAIGTTSILTFIFVVPFRSDVQKVCVWFTKFPNISKFSVDCEFTEKLYKNHPEYPHAMTQVNEPYIIGVVIVSIGHLLFYISVGQNLYMLKPMSLFAVSVEKMILDALKWIIFLLIFLAGFSNAMLTLYNNYKCGNSFFSDIREAWRRLFWVLFAMTDVEDSKLKGAFLTNSTKMEGLVSVFGDLFYSLFFLIGTLILVNLLIALMSVTYQNINDNCEEILCFVQTKVKLKYILWNDSLPMPFNLLYPLYVINRYIWMRVCKPNRQTSVFRNHAIRRIQKEKEKFLKHSIAVRSKKQILIQRIKSSNDLKDGIR